MSDNRNPSPDERSKRVRRGVYPPGDLQTQVAELLRDVGVSALSRELRIHREQLISIAAGVLVLEGTIALARERLRERGGCMSIEAIMRDQLRAVLREELPDVLAEILESKVPRSGLVMRAECARYLGISPRSLDTLRAQGLPTVWVLDSPRFDLAEVTAWLRARGGK